MNASAYPFAIAVAPNGARRTKADHPRLPITADEIARDAAEACEAGAAMIHLHIRDDEGCHVLDASRYGEAIAAVRAAVGEDLVVQITTEAVGRYHASEQIALVDAVGPESVSLALREIVPDATHERAASGLIERMERAGTLWQLIIYEPDELERIATLARRGVLPDGPLAVLAVLGRYSQAAASGAELDAYLAAGIDSHQWMLCAFGPREAAFMARAADAGGHARVGFENNLLLPDGSLASGNADLVAAVARQGGERGIANAEELRRLWRMASPLRQARGDGVQRALHNAAEGGARLQSFAPESPQGGSSNRETPR